MARPKPDEITSKIIRAENLRLRALSRDPEFQRDLRRLEEAAKSLPQVPLISPSKLSTQNWRLPARIEKEFSTWSEAANAFRDRWGFKPYLNETHSVELFVRSPVSFSTSLDTGNVTEFKLNTHHHPLGDVAALAKHYKTLRTQRSPTSGKRSTTIRRHFGTLELKLRAGELAARQTPYEQIAAELFPDEYKKAVGQDPIAEAKFRQVAQKYLHAPYSLRWPDAEQRAAKELGLDLRSHAAKLKSLIQRVRDLLK
jgi:hypothetical protein